MRCALVTGGGKGIGMTITSYLSKTMDVFIVGRDEQSLAALSFANKEEQFKIHYLAGDLTNPETLEKLAAEIERISKLNA